MKIHCLLSLVVCLSSGCASVSEKALVGSYHSDRKPCLSANDLFLTLYADHTFDWVAVTPFPIVEASSQTEFTSVGVWRVDGRLLSLTFHDDSRVEQFEVRGLRPKLLRTETDRREAIFVRDIEQWPEAELKSRTPEEEANHSLQPTPIPPGELGKSSST
jgi:hypothetical protein